MRLTTKIFIGFLFFILSLVIAAMLYMKTKEVDRDTYWAGKNFAPQMKALDIPQYKVICIDELKDIDNSRITLQGTINLHEGASDKMYINSDLAPLTKIHLKEDTLFVSFDTDGIFKLLEIKQPYYRTIDSLKISFPASREVKLVSHMFRLNADIENVELDELDLSLTRGVMNLNNSKIGILSTKNRDNIDRYAEAVSYWVTDSQIGVWYLDMKYFASNNYDRDNGALKIENSTIDTLNMTGEENYTIPYVECNVLNWLPIGDKALLKINLEEAISIKMNDR